MKATAIWIALGFVCAFSLGWAVRGFQSPTPSVSTPSGMARAVVNGNVIDYPADSGFEFEASAVTRSDEGNHTLSRDTQAVSGGLTTNSAEVAANYEQTAPTDGLGASGGGIISTIKAKAGGQYAYLWFLAAGMFVAACIAFVKIDKQLGVALAAGSVGVAAIAWFAEDERRALFGLIFIGLGAIGYWMYHAGMFKATKSVAVPITKGIASLEATNPAAFEAATKAIGAVSGTIKGTPQREKMDRRVRKLKSN